MNHYEQTTQEVRDAFNALCKGRVEAAVKAEREACAKVCDAAYDEFFVRHELEYPKARYDKDSVTRTVKAAVEFVAEDVAAAIRARGNT